MILEASPSPRVANGVNGSSVNGVGVINGPNGHRHTSGAQETSTQLILASANTQDSLRRHIDNLGAYIAEHPAAASDVAHTLAVHREHLPQRAFMLVGGDGSVAQTSPLAKIPTTQADIIMVFSGQGAQWPQMGKDLLERDQEFSGYIAEMDEILASLICPPSWTIRGKNCTFFI